MAPPARSADVLLLTVDILCMKKCFLYSKSDKDAKDLSRSLNDLRPHCIGFVIFVRTFLEFILLGCCPSKMSKCNSILNFFKFNSNTQRS